MRARLANLEILRGDLAAAESIHRELLDDPRATGMHWIQAMALIGLAAVERRRGGLDAASVGLIAGMGIGRIGDLINGEHLAKATDLPWGVIYTHPDSPAFAHSIAVGAHHPATTYEMLGDFAILALAIYLVLGPLRTWSGLTFFIYLDTYAVMRYFVSMLRVDSADTFFFNVSVPQLVSLAVIAVTIPPIVYLLRRGRVVEPEPPLPPGRMKVRQA